MSSCYQYHNRLCSETNIKFYRFLFLCQKIQLFSSAQFLIMAACNFCLNLESNGRGPSNFEYINMDQQCPRCFLETVLADSEVIRPSSSSRARPTVEIVVEPIEFYRFRFKCEHTGNRIFPLKGAHDTAEKKSFTTIKVNGYQGPFKVLVSCVTKDGFRWAIKFDIWISDTNEKKKTKKEKVISFTNRQHPYILNGDGCKNGICIRKIEKGMTVVFSQLGIQRPVKKKFSESLKERKEQEVDPFNRKQFKYAINR